MPGIVRLEELWQRLNSYDLLEVAVELAVIWAVVLVIFRFVQGTRAAGAMKGTLVLVVVVSLAARIVAGEAFGRLDYLYDRVLGLAALGLVIVFQPELRRALIRLGETPWFRASQSDLSFIAEQVAGACEYLSKAKFGAIVVLERQVKLEALTEGGTTLRAELSTRLLQTLFYPGTALHDLAVVVRGKVVQAAGVQLPMADPSEMPDPGLGARHRAAVGISKECDAIVVIVSEETGLLRIAERGKLSTPYPPRVFRAQLLRRLEKRPAATDGESASDAQDLEQVQEGTLADETVGNLPETADEAPATADGGATRG